MRTAYLTAILLIILVPFATGETAYENFPALTGPYLGQTPPGDQAVEFGAGFIVPPEGFHSSAVFSPDSREVVWTSMGQVTYYSRMEDGRWTRPVRMIIDTVYGIGEACFSPDGSRLYFLYRKPPPDDPVDRERIWYVDRTASGWSEPHPIDSIVRAHATHWQFTMAGNGNLYFTSEDGDDLNSRGIFMAPWSEDGYGEPVNLGAGVNTDVRDFSPYIAPDESYLLFARSVPEENNRADLFVSFKDSLGNWTQAINLGDDVNSLHNDVCPMVTPDGRFLIFPRISGEINGLFWVSTSVIDRLRPNSAGATR
ncbi:MAG TPA: hypothetical protein PLF13_01250 [candidate division Zixibacteria bacterium]|nr:hypothetical protein [candidate division Zixibacteria bacterium]